MVRKVIFELILLGIAIGLTVEVIKSAIPYLPLIWLAVMAHYTWEILTSDLILSKVRVLQKRLCKRHLLYSYIAVCVCGAALLCLYWWGLTSFFAPKIKAYETEQRYNKAESKPASTLSAPEGYRAEKSPAPEETHAPKKRQAVRRATEVSKEAPVLTNTIAPDEEERRRSLLNTIGIEWMSTHIEDIKRAYPNQSHISPDIPPGYVNHRLYELGESWTVGIPDRIMKLSNKDLRSEAASISHQMRDLQLEYANDGDHNLTLAQTMQRSTMIEQKWGLVRATARNIMLELERRVGRPEVPVGYVNPEDSFSVQHLTGARPFERGAKLIDELAAQLPK